MQTPEVRNWFGNITSTPTVVVEPHNVQELIAVMQDSIAYPSPVRAVGSNHSTTACGAAALRAAEMALAFHPEE